MLLSLFNFHSPILRKYNQYRNIQKQLNSQITEEYLSPEILEEIADWFGFLQGNNFVVASETEVDIMNDFFLYEFRDPNNRRIVDRAQEDYSREVNKKQNNILTAMCQSQTLLVEVLRTSPKEGIVQANPLRGLPTDIVTFTDQGFSLSLEPGIVLFTRIITLPELSMTSGAAFAFDSSNKKRAIRTWDRAAKKYPSQPQQTQFLWRHFLYFNRETGIETAFI